MTDLIQVIDVLIEATASVDAEFRRQATREWDRLVRKVKSIVARDEFSTLDKIDITGHRGKIPARVIRLSTEFGPLIVALVAKGNGAGFAMHKGVPFISLDALIADDDPKFLETRINSVKKSFVHEFIHFLDVQRGVPSIGSERMRRGGSWEDYAIAPDEFNAFYQEGASEVEGFYRSRQTRRLGDIYVKAKHANVIDQFWEKILFPALADYKAFERFALPKFDKDWVKAIQMNSKYKRKLQKRLYGLYEHLKKEYGK